MLNNYKKKNVKKITQKMLHQLIGTKLPIYE